MKHSQTSKKIGWYALILSIICLGIVGHDGARNAMGATGSQVDCRVELDRDILPAGDPQQVVVKVTLDAPPPPSHINRPPVNL